jgi:hypothetical protein
MKTLKVSTQTLDQVNSFTISNFKYENKCSLHKDYQKDGDGIYWVLQHGACLQAHYSEADMAEKARLQLLEYIIADGEIVLIEGEQYKFKFLGNYSDCGIFDKVVA